MDPIVVVSDSRHRRAAKPRRPLLKILFYATSLLPAAFIVWRYDLLNKLDRRLKGEAPPSQVVQAAPMVTPPPPVRSRVVAAPVRPSSSLRPIETVMQTPVEPEPEVMPRRPFSPLNADTAPKPEIAHVIDLDLERRRQAYELADPKQTEFRVTSLRGCSAPYSIKPKDGRLDGTNDVSVIVTGDREIVIRVSLKESSSAPPAIFIEGSITTDAGRDMPLTLTNIDRACVRIIKQGEEAAATLAALEAEKTRTEAWIASPVMKPLLARNEARARVGQLGVLIPEQTALINSLRANLEVAQRLQKLVVQLHEECELEIANVESLSPSSP